jgi:hypothetical protein
VELVELTGDLDSVCFVWLIMKKGIRAQWRLQQGLSKNCTSESPLDETKIGKDSLSLLAMESDGTRGT